MELDSQLLQDLLDFLRTLEGVSLPVKFEILRGQLLGRVSTAISVAGNYMDMQPGKLLKSDNFSVADDSSEEYVVSDQQTHTLARASTSFLHQLKNKNADNVDAKVQPRPSPPDRPQAKALILEISPDPLPHPQSGQNVVQLPVIATEEDPGIPKVVEDADEQLESYYNNMGLTIAEAKADYSGKLQRREKWLVFENLRPFWAALIDRHLLTYDNRSDQKPTQILSVKECTCKPVDMSQRSVKKFAESTFELSFDDNRSYQFIASTPKEMEQWIARIARCKSKPHDNSNNAKVSPSGREIMREEAPKNNSSDSLDYYDDLVIPNIAEMLATPSKAPKLQISRSQEGQRTPKTLPKLNETRANSASPTCPKLFNRVLPSLPPQKDPEQEDEMYQDISEQNESSSSNGVTEGPVEEVYDDIETVREEAKQMKDNMARKYSPVKEIPDDDLTEYDDVAVVRKAAENLRRNDSIAKESIKIENDKKTLSPPLAVPARPSPVKNLLDKLRQRSESPEKVAAKKKPPVLSPQQLAKTQTPIGRPVDQGPVETVVLSNYNSLPRPRPIEIEKSIAGNGEDDDEEEIYIDVVDKNHIAGLRHAIAKRKENENSTRVGASQSIKTQKNVARNLNETFEDEIYENRSGVESNKDELEHYQVPRADANAHSVMALEDNDEEEIYDDVAIVVQKKREIEESKQKPVVKTPQKLTQGPAVMAKPSAHKLLNKFNKFSLSVSDKSTPEKNNQNRLIAGKKPKTQEGNIALRKRQLTYTDEELYDDCLAK